MRLQKLVTLFILAMSACAMAQYKMPGTTPWYRTPNANAFVNVQTPTAASLGKYGDINMSLFTGSPAISIPLYEMDVRGVKMPISLDYDASGVMPNSLPSWAGQNWTLNVGGVITRTVKGKYDEWVYSRNSTESNLYKTFSNYFKCHNLLHKDMAEGDPYTSLKRHVDEGLHDIAPDEYTFHFMGKSGKFFLDYDGNWRVKSNDNIEVIYDYKDSANYIGSLFELYPKELAAYREQCKTIAGFVLRDDEGYTYTFGYDKDAIEYTTDFWSMSTQEDEESWHATSWYLTKVTDRCGNLLYRIRYTRGSYVIQVFNARYENVLDERATGLLGTSFYNYSSNSFFPYTISISSPAYLRSIEGMNGTYVTISSGDADDALATENLYLKLYKDNNGIYGLYDKMMSLVNKWSYTPGSSDYIGAFYYLQSNDNDSLKRFRHASNNDADVLARARIRKIRDISIQHHDTKSTDCIGFRLCMSTSNNRMRLDSVMMQDNAVHYSKTTGIKGVYRFRYDRFEDLPGDYLTTCVDHWGYYNGRDYTAGLDDKEHFCQYRDPDFRYTPVGILTEIEYPTKGVTCFKYEPNTYGKVLSEDRQSVRDAEGTGGGLRIKSVMSYDTPEKKTLLGRKDYLYNIPGTSTSSGELFATPIYYWKNWKLKCVNKNVTYSMSTFHTSAIVQLANSTGVSLGYSWVTEDTKDTDAPDKTIERHVYHYSNISDPAVRDQRFDLTFGYTDQVNPYEEWSDLGFKKGLLLEERTYGSDGNKAKSTTYRYRDDNYMNNSVLTSNLTFECFGNSNVYYHYLGGVYKLYYPKYDVVNVTDTVFHADGSMPTVTRQNTGKTDIRFTTCQPYKHQKDVRVIYNESTCREDMSEAYTYIYGDFSAKSGLDSVLYKVDSYIKPLKTIHESNGNFVSEEEYKFAPFTVNGCRKYMPSLVTRHNGYGVTDTLVTYSKYTDTGMPTAYHERGQTDTFLTWGGNDCYLMLKGNTPLPQTMPHEQFRDQEECFSWVYDLVNNRTSGLVTGYVWNPIFGPTAILMPNGNTNTYQYDNFGRLVKILDYDGTPLKEYQYNYRK